MAVIADAVQVVEVAVPAEARVDALHQELKVGNLPVLLADCVQIVHAVNLEFWLHVNDVTL